jgi:hypothetical protein
VRDLNSITSHPTHLPKRTKAALGHNRNSVPELPPLLPYLSDRSDQEISLQQALNYHKKNRSRRPFICIIHGDEREAHDRFLERLDKISFLKLLGLDPDQIPIKNYGSLKWPVSPDTPQDRLERLKNEMATRLVGRSPATPEEMVKVVIQHRGPVMICTHLRAENWRRHETELIKRWFHFWNNEWPDVAPGQQLSVFLNIHYVHTASCSLFEKWRRERLHKRIRNFVTTLDFLRYDELSGVTLPELQPVFQKDAEDWAREYRDSIADFRDALAVLQGIQELYERTKVRSIPMRELGDNLKKLLMEIG